jgi:hypothetical protein
MVRYGVSRQGTAGGVRSVKSRCVRLGSSRSDRVLFGQERRGMSFAGGQGYFIQVLPLMPDLK